MSKTMSTIRWSTWISAVAIASVAAGVFAQDNSLGKSRNRDRDSGKSNSKQAPPAPPTNRSNSNRDSKANERAAPPMPPTNQDRERTRDRDIRPMPPANQNRERENRVTPPQDTQRVVQDDSLGKGRGRGSGGSSGGSSGSTTGGSSGGGRQTPPPMPPARSQGGDNRGNLGSGQSIGDNSLGGSARRQGGSGTTRSNYGTQNNLTSRGTTRPIDIQNAPLVRPQGRTLAGQVLRQENTRPNYNYRNGYYHYDRGWCDDYWGYSYYRFSYNDNCAVSPWYNYSYLPAYIDCNRINWERVIVNIAVNVIHDWTYRDRYDRRSDSYYLDNSVADLVRIWRRQDTNALGRLVSNSGYVTVTFDNNYRYSLSGADFYDMVYDAITTSRTIDYRILDVRSGRGGTRVTAEHRYRDPWNRNAAVYHTYYLGYRDYADSGYYFDDRDYVTPNDDYFNYSGAPTRDRRNNDWNANDRRMCIISFSTSTSRPRY